MKKHILLIEDNLAICEALAELLSLEGYTINTAHNGKEAISYLTRSDAVIPNVILLDLMMPIMDGYAFIKKRKNTANAATIPIIVMSASDIELENLTSLGVAGCCKKPINIAQLLETLKNF